MVAIVLAALVWAGVVATAVSVAAPVANERTPAASVERGEVGLWLPRPRGPYPVGVRSDSVWDPARIDTSTGRARRLPVRVWYPASREREAASAPYLSPFVQAFVEQAIGVPSGTFDVDTHAAENARARRHVRGVILFQPGGGSLVAFYTGLVIELASRGYVVVTTDHPHDSVIVEEPGGEPILEAPNSTDLPLAERVRDGSVVLDALARLVPQARRGTPIGMFGHSRGGAATPELMFHDERVSAGVALDVGTVLFVGGPTSPPGDVVAAGLDRPLGLLCSLDQPCESPLVADFISRLRAPHPAHTLEILHNGFTDFVVFNPQAARTEPAVAQIFEQFVPTGTLDSLAKGLRALTEQRRFLTAFMGRHLERRRSHQVAPTTRDRVRP
jgi:dienelactone hydrolase